MKFDASFNADLALASPPTRGRGLKFRVRLLVRHYGESPPTRGRGLKYLSALCCALALSRPPRGGVD